MEEVIKNPLHIKKEADEDQTKMEDNPICISCLLCYFICLPLFSLFGSN
jgi:succinate dehydrogenase/fumarate reductase-like Fe-S protein